MGPDKAPAIQEATRRLIALGHRRILLLCRRVRRLPEPGRVEREFLRTMGEHGLPVSAFNLPDWEETPEGFQTLLREIFRVSQPTALIVDEVPFFFATQQFLLGRGLRVPGQVSLVACDDDPAFAWCSPPIAHCHWDFAPIVRHITRWAVATSEGRTERRQMLFPAEFVPGGSIGPVGLDTGPVR